LSGLGSPSGMIVSSYCRVVRSSGVAIEIVGIGVGIVTGMIIMSGMEEQQESLESGLA